MAGELQLRAVVYRTRLYACPKKEREKEPIPPEKSKPKQKQYRNDCMSVLPTPPRRCVMVTSTGALVGMASWCFASCEAFIVSAPTTLSARPTSTAARMSAGSDYVSTLPGGGRDRDSKTNNNAIREFFWGGSILLKSGHVMHSSGRIYVVVVLMKLSISTLSKPRRVVALMSTCAAEAYRHVDGAVLYGAHLLDYRARNEACANLLTLHVLSPQLSSASVAVSRLSEDIKGLSVTPLNLKILRKHYCCTSVPSRSSYCNKHVCPACSSICGWESVGSRGSVIRGRPRRHQEVA